MDQLTLSYPAWFILFCLLLGAAYAALLYYRDNTFRDQASWLRWTMSGLRFLGASIIAFFLLSPLLRYTRNESRKPVIVLAQDVSQSVRDGIGKEQIKSYQQKLEQLRKDLQGDYDVKAYSFGSSIREGFSDKYEDKISNLAEVFNTAYDNFAGDNLGAIILASDGIYNEGNNPLYLSEKTAAPIYTIALGDTTPKKDLVLKRVFHNKIAYLGDQFSVLADVAAVNCGGSSTSFSIYKIEDGKSRLVSSQALKIDKNDFFSTKEVILNADQAGVQRYRIVVNKVNGENSTQNNSQDIFVDVLDARQKILLLALSPHPDLSAIRQTISSNKNYEVEVAFVRDFKGSISGYDFVVLHQLPGKGFDASGILSTLDRERIPRLFIVGSQSDFQGLNRLQNLVTLQADGRNTNDVQPKLAGNFSLFIVEDDVKNELDKYPPIQAPFGEFKSGGSAQVMLYQRIRKIDTQYPLLTFGEKEGVRIGMLLAENIWRWRLFNYLQDENHAVFDAWMGKVVQYLGVKEDKRKFRVNVSKNIYRENEQVFFDAELYNKSYELVNDPDVRLVVTSEKGKEYTFTFNKSGRAYSLNAGTLPVGNYKFTGKVTYSGEQLSYNGQFSVQPIQLEQYETTADHRLLRLMSEQSGGKMLSAAQMNDLPKLIKDMGTVKPIIFQNTTTRSLISIKWLFFLLLLMLSGEWFLRRYLGSY
jgi:hypothetical protein